MPAPTYPATVLLVDDNEMFLQQLAQRVTALGYKVFTANNGAEGIEKALALHPDLIIIDIQMPGIDGLQAARTLRQQASTAVIPIIALTTLRMPGYHERCLAAGMNAYLQKPLNITLLRNTIEQHLATHPHSADIPDAPSRESMRQETSENHCRDHQKA